MKKIRLHARRGQGKVSAAEMQVNAIQVEEGCPSLISASKEEESGSRLSYGSIRTGFENKPRSTPTGVCARKCRLGAISMIEGLLE